MNTILLERVSLLRGWRWDLAILGAVVAVVLVLPWKAMLAWITSHLWLGIPIIAIIGAAAGLFLAALAGWLRQRGVALDHVTLKLPGVGDVPVALLRAQRPVAQRLFVELSTRAVTCSLKRADGEDLGQLRAVLDSLYKVFLIFREELKQMPPTSSIEQATVETYAHAILNHVLRPFLSRWHWRLELWEATGSPEVLWPLASLCRTDLDTTRILTLEAAYGLGRLAEIPQLEQLVQLPPPEELSKATMVSFADIHRVEMTLYSTISPSQSQVVWHIFQELVSRVATQALGPDEGSLRVTLTSLYSLYDTIRTELKQMPPSPPMAFAEDAKVQEPVEAIALRVLNGPLRKFLAKWHPRLDAWEKAHDGQEVGWEEADDCRAALAEVQTSLRQETERLGRLLRLPQLDIMLGRPGESTNYTAGKSTVTGL
ncbi:MAG: hypothetical protein ACYDCO_23075 [Armatimonadota bacterium]